MIRPHSPNETPADKPAHSGEGGGAWSSPWELDHEWQEAPPARKRAIPQPLAEEKEAAAPKPQAAASPVRSREPEIEKTVPHSRPSPSAMPQRSRPHLAPERDSSWASLAILCMGLLGFVFVLWVYLEDEETAGFDEDLVVKRVVDPAVSIHTPEKLLKFLDSLAPVQNPALRDKPPWLWDTPTLSRIVQENGAALDNLRDLLEDADWHPQHSAWHAEDLCADARWNQALLLKQAEAAYLSRRMEEVEAFTAAIDLAEIGWRLEQIHAWPSCYQRALQAHTLAAQTLADLLRQTKLPEVELRQFQRQFSLCQPGVEMLGEALKAFYVHEKKLILGPKSGENLDTMPGGAQLQRPGRLFFKPNATVQLFATAFRQMSREVQAPLAHLSEVRLENIPSRKGSLQPNTEGLNYFTERMKIYTPLPAFLGLARARGNLIITLFAIRRCVAERKTLPASLDQLREFRYLLDVPLDPYSGAPLNYNLSRGLISSVGNDLKNAGGAPTEPPLQDAREPTVEIGISVAAAVK
ncbi:MAG: hypothetical protein R3F13_18265 [Prosthecobacter sp.]